MWFSKRPLVCFDLRWSVNLFILERQVLGSAGQLQTCSVAKGDLGLLIFPCLSSAGTTGVCYHAQLM